MADTIRLDVLWNLHITSEQLNNFAIYINFLTQHEKEELRNFFYEPSHPPVSLDQIDRSLVPRATLLSEEVVSHLPSQHTYDLGPTTVTAKIERVNLVHNATPSWAGQRKNPDDLRWVMVLKLGGIKLESKEGMLSVESLSTQAKETIKQLDGFAIEIAYKRYINSLSRFVDLDPAFRPSPSKYKVFISYRKKSGLELAKSIHRALKAYSNNTIFEPYLDEHNLRLGKWEAQILVALDTSDIFVPIITAGYADLDTMSSKELSWALELNQKNGFPIAPIFARETKSEKFSDLKKYHALMLGKRSLEEAQTELNDFLRIMTRTVTENSD
jgi:hypothetical protein